MREKLNNVNFRKLSFITVMMANVIYLINIIICAIGFFNLDVSNQEQQWEKENGLLEYVAIHTNESILLTIAWLVFLLAGAFLYVSYILEKNGALKIVMMVCSIIVVVNYLLYLLLEFLAKVIVGGMGLFQLIALGLLGIWLLALVISGILLLIDAECRKGVFALVLSWVWIMCGEYLIALAIGGVIVGIIIMFVQASEEDESNVLFFKDKYGKITKWRKVE